MPGSVTKTSSTPRLPTRREPQHINRDVASSNSEAFLAGQRLIFVEDASQDLELAGLRPPTDEVMIAAMNHGRAIATRSIRSATPCPDDPADALSPLCPRTPDPNRFQPPSPSLGEWSSSDDSGSESSLDWNCPPSTPKWDQDDSQPETMEAEPPLTSLPASSVPPTPAPELPQITSPNRLECLFAEDGAPEPQRLRDLPPFEEEPPPSAFVSKDALLPSWGRNEDSSDLLVTELQTMTEPDASQAMTAPGPSSNQATNDIDLSDGALELQQLLDFPLFAFVEESQPPASVSTDDPPQLMDSRPITPDIGNLLPASPTVDDLLSPDDRVAQAQRPNLQDKQKDFDLQQNLIAMARSAMEAEEPADTKIAAVPPIEAGEQDSKTLRRLTSDDLTILAVALLFNPQLNLAAWACAKGIIPDHATACVTDGTLNKYGQARLNGALFRNLRSSDMVSLHTWLKQPNQSAQQWAMENRIHPYSITDYVTDGALNATGLARLTWTLGWQRNIRQRNSEKINLRRASRQERQSFRHRDLELLDKGQGPTEVAKTLQLARRTVQHCKASLGRARNRSCQTAYRWSIALAKRGDRAVEPLKRGGPTRKLTPAQEEQLLTAYCQQTPADFDLKPGPWSVRKLSEASVKIIGKKVSRCLVHQLLHSRGLQQPQPWKATLNHRAVGPLNSRPGKLTRAQEEKLLNAYRQQTPADFGLKSGQWTGLKLSEASGKITGQKVSRDRTRKFLRDHKLLRPRRQPWKAPLNPLKNEELRSLMAKLEENPALNVEDWARMHGIIPYHATACVTQGMLNAYGLARLRGKTTFRHLNDEGVKALKAHLKNPDPNIEGWAIEHGFFLHEVNDCISKDGKLSALGKARWALAIIKRTKSGTPRKSPPRKIIHRSTLGTETYQTLHREAIKRLKLGLGQTSVANELGIPRPTVHVWHRQLMKRGE